jgi:hypothetical protein
MRFLILLFLALCVVLRSAARGAEVPEAPMHELQVIRKSISYAHVELPDRSESNRFWASMRELGKLAQGTPAPGWITTLTPIEKRIIVLAIDHYNHPALAKTLIEQYGRYKNDLPQKIVPSFEQLHEEHATKEYQCAWEAWILAPGSTEKALMIGNICSAIARCGTADSVPLVMMAVEQKPEGEVPGAKPLKFEQYAARTLLTFKTEASVVGLLNLMEMNMMPGRATFFGVSELNFKDPKTTHSKLEALFVQMVSGYIPNPGTGLSHFNHRDGKLWLPAIDEVLKKPDLKPGWRTLLQRTKETIEKYCLQ